MSKADIIVFVVIIVIASLAFYEGFIRHRKEPCHGCPYAKNCTSSCKRKK